MVGGNWLKSILFLFLDHLPGFPNYTFLNFQKKIFSLHPSGQYRGTKVLKYRGTFLVPVPSVLLWYRYRGTLLFFGGTGTLVLFYFLVGILRT